MLAHVLRAPAQQGRPWLKQGMVPEETWGDVWRRLFLTSLKSSLFLLNPSPLFCSRDGGAGGMLSSGGASDTMTAVGRRHTPVSASCPKKPLKAVGPAQTRTSATYGPQQSSLCPFPCPAMSNRTNMVTGDKPKHQRLTIRTQNCCTHPGPSTENPRSHTATASYFCNIWGAEKNKQNPARPPALK